MILFQRMESIKNQMLEQLEDILDKIPYSENRSIASGEIFERLQCIETMRIYFYLLEKRLAKLEEQLDQTRNQNKYQGYKTDGEGRRLD